MRAEQARALLAAPELLAAASPDDLRVGEQLRERWPADLVAAASEQVALRLRAAAKFDDAGAMLFTRAGLEQASMQVVAAHRARRFAEALAGSTGPLLDLCCGIGGDLVALGAASPRGVVGVDRDEAHAVLARHNARVCGVAAAVVVADVRDVRVEGVAAVFADPARRTAGGQTDRRGGYSPALDWCLALPAARVCVKTAPGLDRAAVPPGWEAEFVAVGRDLKEAALWSPAWAGGRARASVLPSGDSLVADPAAPPADVRPPGVFLLDPSPAVTRAGAVADLAAATGTWQVDRRIAFLCGDVAVRTPFATSYAVEASLPFGVKALAAELRRLDIGAIDLRRRGLAGDVEDLRRRLRPAGSRRATVMLTRVVDRPWTLVCTPLADA